MVEVTSEDEDCPVESAFGSGSTRGWSAAVHQVELSGVTILELTINPNISGGSARASLRNLRLS